MNTPFPAYQGDAPYVFICYSHRDAETVYADLINLRDNGINTWYDEGIEAGKPWRAEIARAIRQAQSLVFFISKHSIESAHCMREVDFALQHDVNIIPVFLDDSALPEELALVLNRVQALYRQKDTRYLEHLLASTKGGALKPLFGKPNTRAAWKMPAIAVTAILLITLLIQLRSVDDSASSAPDAVSVSTVATSAYDDYLAASELVERWDQDDNLQRAIDLFRDATTQEPTFALAYARLADALRISYGLSGDESILEDAIAQVDAAVRLNANLAPVQMALGRIQLTRGNTDLAFAAAERALEIDANDAAANQAMAAVYERLGRREDAEESFRKAISLDPERISTLNAFGNFLFRQSRYQEAAELWESVVQVAPDHYAALVNLGAAYNESGRIGEAINLYQRAITIQPTYMAYSNLGTAYSRGNRYAEAIDAYRNALAIDQNNWLAWGNLALVYSLSADNQQLAQETFNSAIELAEAARQQNLRDPFVHSDLGLYYAKTSQPELAEQRINTALTLAPDSGEILAVAAEVYEVLGERSLAIDHAARAIDLGYSQQRLRQNPGLSDLLSDPMMPQVPL